MVVGLKNLNILLIVFNRWFYVLFFLNFVIKFCCNCILEPLFKMKKLMSVSVLMPILLIVMIISGCLNKNTSGIKADNQLDLKAINDSVAKLNSGPAYLLRKAKYELAANDPYTAKTDIENLLKQYPNSYQVPAAKELLSTIDRKIINVAEEKEKQNVPKSDKHKFKSDVFAVSVNSLSVPFEVVSYHTLDFTNRTILIESHEVSPPRYYHFKILSESTTGSGNNIIATLNLSSADLPIINKLVYSTSLGYLFYSGNDNLITYGKLSVVY